MDIITDIEGAFARVEAHIKNLFENGAPHQKPHAQDLQTVLAAAKGAPSATTAVDTTEFDNLKVQVATLNTDLDAANGKLATLQANADNLLTVRDSLQTQLDTASVKIADLETQLAAAKSPLSAAAVSTGGRIASGTDASTADPSTGAVVQPAAQP